jgi:hypothetical protein
MRKYGLFLGFLAILMSGIAGAQTILTVAGDGTAAYGGDGGMSTLAKVNSPHGVATDAAGNVYVADYNNHRIRKISTTGVITTIAGTGFGGYLASQDGGPATAAWIRWPIGIAVNASGDVYFSDFGNNIIRKVSAAGIITTIAGIPGSIPGYGGDGGPATAATLGNAWGVAVDASGNVLIADALNHRLRKVTVSTGVITTIAGMGFVGFAGDGGPATSSACRLNEPTGVAVDGAGNIYIADNSNNRVRKINTSGIISTIAGVGLPYGYTGDGGPATSARLYYPKGIAADNAGNVYISDWNNNVVRKINTSGMITTIAGTGVAGYSGDGIAAVSSQLDHPIGLAVRNSDGDIFIADDVNNRVRRIKVGNDPYFTLGTHVQLTTCPSEFSLFDSLMKVDDIDVGQTLTWSPVMLPSHAVLVVTATATSTGSTVTPSGTTYMPTVGYSGPDTFSVRVTDGVYSDTIKVYVTNILYPNAGVITGVDSVCPGLTANWADTASGGVWTSSNTSVATVSSSGVVSGVAPGSVVISYTVSNFCGSASAVKTMRVLATVPCFAEVNGSEAKVGRNAVVYPNPNSGSFSVQLRGYPVIKTADITIYDVTGRLLVREKMETNGVKEFSLNLQTGIYLIEVSTDEGRSFKSLNIN